jgi:hypothetical protein
VIVDSQAFNAEIKGRKRHIAVALGFVRKRFRAT